MNHEKGLAALIALACVVFSAGLHFLPWQTVAPLQGGVQPVTGSGAVLNVEVEPSPSAEEQHVSLVAVGDIMLSRTVERKMKKNGMEYPFRSTVDFLRDADITFGNLECPITSGPSVPPFAMSFRAPIESAPVLREAGFDILSLANNHSMNFGAKGIRDTFALLRENMIAYAGAGEDAIEAARPAIVTTKGVTFAFLAYNDEDVVPDGYEATDKHPGTAFMRIESMVEAVKAAKTQADFVIVSMHSGIEYVNKPNKHQTAFAHAAIDAGAEMVIGHHPHVVQSLEKYNGKYIFYSLGNFVFDQMEQRETREGLAVKVLFGAVGVSNITLHPVLIYDYAQPRFLEGEEAERVIKKLNYPVGEDGIVRL